MPEILQPQGQTRVEGGPTQGEAWPWHTLNLLRHELPGKVERWTGGRRVEVQERPEPGVLQLSVVLSDKDTSRCI